jgi:hypothetical protein
MVPINLSASSAANSPSLWSHDCIQIFGVCSISVFSEGLNPSLAISFTCSGLRLI